MRPPGEIRRLIAHAMAELAAEKGGATWLAAAERARVTDDIQRARKAVENLHQAGALQAVGAEKRPHSRRWMTLYAPPALAAAGSLPPPHAQLAAVMLAWQGRAG
jgi:hypothetical protein